MVEHAKKLAQVAENVAIKCPATEAGIAAMEELTSIGITINATVSYSVSQALAVAEAVERGLQSARVSAINTDEMGPVITLMVGRIDDQLKRVAEKEAIQVEPDYLEWAGVSVFKKAQSVFREKGYSSMLLAAAYRNEHQWLELTGPGAVLSIPYKWWKKFNDMNVEVTEKLHLPVDDRIVNELRDKFSDFRQMYDENSLQPSEFATLGAAKHTLNQFLSAYDGLVGVIRERILQSGA
jgi:transaldolase